MGNELPSDGVVVWIISILEIMQHMNERLGGSTTPEEAVRRFTAAMRLSFHPKGKCVRKVLVTAIQASVRLTRLHLVRRKCMEDIAPLCI